MSECRYIVGDVFEQLAKIPDGSIDFLITSPPFLKQRSYLPDDHPDKDKEIGQEPSPVEFLSTLLRLSDRLRRVLAPHGSICVELGDKYAGSGGAGGDYDEGGLREGQERYGRTGGEGWPLDKSLCGIPTLYAWSLAYGWNLLDPREPVEQWIVRNLIAWHRPNPPVGRLGDKCRPSTSYMTVACTSPDRWFDLHAEEVQGVPLDCWIMSPSRYAGAHYATFPVELPTQAIALMCPRHVCTVCGEPRRRLVEMTPEYAAARAAIGNFKKGHDVATGINGTTQYAAGRHMSAAEYVTVGWSDCGHDSWRRGVVLDPFGGSGSTGVAAGALGRDSILIDLDERNLDLARDRLGMFLAVG